MSFLFSNNLNGVLFYSTKVHSKCYRQSERITTETTTTPTNTKKPTSIIINESVTMAQVSNECDNAIHNSLFTVNCIIAQYTNESEGSNCTIDDISRCSLLVAAAAYKRNSIRFTKKEMMKY